MDATARSARYSIALKSRIWTMTTKTKTVIVARLFIEITNGKKTDLYHLVQLDPDPNVAKVAWQLAKDDGECHEVAVTEAGNLSCTCGDFLWRKHHGCKHVRGLMQSGLISKEKK